VANKLSTTFNAKLGLSIAQVVSRRPFTTETRVRAGITPNGICGTGTDFSPSSSVLF
jgi:hypothetical protein